MVRSRCRETPAGLAMTLVATSDECDAGTMATSRRNRVLAASRALVLLVACCQPQPNSDGAPAASAASAPGMAPVPIFRSATLTGVLVEQSGARRSARLELTRRGSELDGTMRFGESPVFRLLEARLTVLSSSGTPSEFVFGVSYRLSYQTDECEHVRPEQVPRSEPCFYIEGSPRPRHLLSGEAQLGVQKTEKLWTASALGTCDATALASAYDVSGRAVPAEDANARAVSATTTAPSGNAPGVPFRNATLTGIVVAQSGPGPTARLELVRRGSELDGTIRFGDSPALRLLEARLTLRSSGAANTYDFSYVTDECEHRDPEPAGTRMTRWDPCFYVEGSERARFLRPGKARLNLQRAAGTLTASALGSDGVAYLVTGKAQP